MPDSGAEEQDHVPNGGGNDDLILPFRAERAGATGRIVRLGSAVDTILRRHDYPDAVSKILGEAVALTAMLGTALKIDGKLILQTKTDGAIRFLVVDYEVPGRIRGYAHYDHEALAEIEHDGEPDPEKVMGKGHLAMTIDRGPEMERYQGIVALEGASLQEAADAYFHQSEQLPTFIRLTVAKHYTKSHSPGSDGWAWRAGGLMIQNLSPEGGSPMREEETGEAAEPLGSDDEDWTRARLLAATVEDHELLDPTLEPERLLYRLFHEEGVRVYPSHPIEVHCRCSRDRVTALLDGFSKDELSDMIVGGDIIVTCEFCNTDYLFDASDYL